MDITAHEVLVDGGLKELYKASGGDWGGTYVDMAFWFIYFKQILHSSVYKLI